MSFIARLGLIIACASFWPCLAAAPSPTRVHLEPEIPAAIEVSPISERWDGVGFMPLRVRIENRAGRALAWEFTFLANLGYSGSSLSHRVRLGVEAGEVSETVVFVPGAGSVAHGQRVVISILLDGPGARGYGANLLHGNNDPVIPTATLTASEAKLFGATHNGPGVRTEITTVDPALWPADWRVWSPFKRVVLEEKDHAVLDGARRAALRDWVAMGGTLDLYPSRAGASRGPAPRRHGHGEIRVMERTLEQAAAEAVKQEVVLARSSLESLPVSRGVAIAVERREALRPARGMLGVSLFLVAFGVLIGPVNLFVFAPSGRRHRLFFTMPAISLGASALLAGYIVVKDGFGGEGARQGLVLLLPDSNQAVVTQTQIVRTGVLLGADFEFPDDATLERTGVVQSWSGGGHVHYSGHVEAEREQYERAAGRVGGDWFASRQMQEHTVRRLTPTRARVELVAGGEGENAPPVVQSSVGVVMRDFLYVDPAGRIWSTDELAPGQRVTLRLKPNFAAPGGLGWGTFTAKGGAAEGLAPIPTLDSIRWDDPQFLYAGPVVNARKP